ncbi:hypothetical protein D3C80_1657240 [compost metagenome]
MGHGIDHIVGDDSDDNLPKTMTGSVAGRERDCSGFKARQIGAGSGLKQVANHQSDDDRQGGNAEKIGQRFNADAAKGFAVTVTGDTDHHAGKNDGDDDHFHQLNEDVARRL